MDTLLKNFEIIASWNGEEDLYNLLLQNTEIIEYELKDNLLYKHPIINMLIYKGFSTNDILYCYNFRIFNFKNTMEIFLENLKNLNSNEENNMEWLLKPNNNFKNKTNGDIISYLIASSGLKIYATERESSNPLQGTLEQIFILHYFIDKPWYIQMKKGLNNGSMYNRYKFYQDFFTNYIKFDIMGSGHENDLEQRSLQFTERIINGFFKGMKHCKILTLDGHGRFIIRILTILIDFYENIIDDDIKKKFLSFLNNSILKVYELDPYNHIWHINTLPCCSELNNILGENNDFRWSNDDFVYLNFSGLHDQSERCLELIDDFIKNGNSDKIMISYARCRSAIKIADLFTKNLIKRNFVFLTDRSISKSGIIGEGNFITMGKTFEKIY